MLSKRGRPGAKPAEVAANEKGKKKMSQSKLWGKAAEGVGLGSRRSAAVTSESVVAAAGEEEDLNARVGGGGTGL